MLLHCETRPYAWGKKGLNSEVGKLVKSGHGIELLEDQPYAELWMGTHPSAPSKIAGSDKFLIDYFKENPDAIGIVNTGADAYDLPFLFKVLSVDNALSIQAHPDKMLAKILHERDPEHYPDANHKPEMAIALTKFEALNGFRSINQIKKHVVEYPELRTVIGPGGCSLLFGINDNDLQSTKADVMRKLFTDFMTCDEAVVTQQIHKLVDRLSSTNQPMKRARSSETLVSLLTFSSSAPSYGSYFRTLSALEELILKLYAVYKTDRGVFCPLIMNYLILSPGDAFFMGPNEPHAYISGDCIECMALSDNVVRAGLTPKFKDVDVLCDMLHYRCGIPEFIVPTPVDDYTLCYRPSPAICSEFEVEMIEVPIGLTDYKIPVLPCVSLLLLIRGVSVTYSYSTASGMKGPISLSYGSVICNDANQSIVITTGLESDEGATGAIIFRAHVNMGAIKTTT